MSGGKAPSTQTTTQKVEPWDAAKPYYETLYKSAQDAFGATDRTPYTGPLTAGPQPGQLLAVDYFKKAAQDSSGGVAPLLNLASGVASGQNLTGGPFMANMPGANLASVPQILGAQELMGQLPTARNPSAPGASPGSAAFMAALPQGANYNPLASSLENSVLSGKYLTAGSNPYLMGNIQSAINPVQQRLLREVLPALQDQSIMQGAYGGSGYGTAQGLATSDFTRQALDISSQLMAQNYAAERGYQQNTMGASLGRDDTQFQQLRALTGQNYMQEGQIAAQERMQQQQIQAQLDMQARTLAAQAFGQQQQVAGQAGLQGQQLQASLDQQLRSLFAGNYGTERAAQFQLPALYSAINQLNLQPAQLMDQAGSQEQAWLQQAIDAELQRYNINQAAPWAGMGEWAQILNGGGFSSAGVTAPGASRSGQFLQGAAGVAGIASALAPLFGGGGGGGVGNQAQLAALAAQMANIGKFVP